MFPMMAGLMAPRGKVLMDWKCPMLRPPAHAPRAPAWWRRLNPWKNSQQTFVETLAFQEAAGTLLTTYTTAKSVINPSALCTVGSNQLRIGKILRVFASGGISNIVTTPGLMNFQIKIGAAVAFDTGNIQLNAAAHTTLPFWFDAFLTVRAVGSGTNANAMGQSQVTGIMFTRTAGQTDDVQGMQTIVAPQTAPAVGAGFDSTVANIIDFWAGFTISNAGNGIQIQQYHVSLLN
jgi:hypothetical protein